MTQDYMFDTEDLPLFSSTPVKTKLDPFQQTQATKQLQLPNTPNRCPRCGKFLAKGTKEVYARTQEDKRVSITLNTEGCSSCLYRRLESYDDAIERLGLLPYKEKS